MAIELVMCSLLPLVIQYLKGFLKDEGVLKVVDDLCQKMETLCSELEKMRDLLLGLQQFKEDKKIQGLLGDIQEIVYEVHDLVDEIWLFGVKFHSPLSCKVTGLRGMMSNFFHGWDGFAKRVEIMRTIENFTARIRLVNGHLQDYCSNNDARASKAQEELFGGKFKQMVDYSWQSEPIEEDSFVGMEDQKATLESLLLCSGESLKVISVCGMGGIGKTTLVNHIVQQNDVVKRHFEMFAYASVGSSFRTRNVWKDLVHQLFLWEGRREEVMSLPDLDMAQNIYELLQYKRYLIVLDDVWSMDAWECLSIAFPTSGEMGSRVLLTTRNRQVAEKMAAKEGLGLGLGLGFVHQMRSLTQEEGLELLLQGTAFRGAKLDPDVLEVASNVVSKCQGLPLAIQVLGGLLKTKATLDERDLNVMMQGIDSYQHMEQDSQDSAKISAILALAYDALPYYLKPCYLYLGMFPEGAEIEAERIYLLWLAEGFIPSTDGGSKISMMDVAESFLYELWIRNMVLVQKEEVPTGRRFKSCHLHNLMRDLCLSKSKEDNFSDVIYFRRANHMGVSSHSSFTSNKIQRLAMYFEDGCVVPSHWNIDKQHWSLSFRNTFGYQRELMAPHELPDDLRDLSRLRVLYLCGFNFEVLRFSSMRKKLFPRQFLNLRGLPLILSDLSNLKRLRVLVLRGFNFDFINLPTGIEKLFRLRYLSFRCCKITRMPSSICNLLNLITLDLGECTGIIMIIPNELYKLQRLRYLCLPHRFVVHEVDKLQLDGLRQLETLINFDSRPCRIKDLLQLARLQKLVATVEWKFEELEETINCINMSLKCLCFSSIVVRNSDCNLKEKIPLVSKLFGCLKIQSINVEGPIGELPPMFSQSFTEIYFNGSELKEDPIENLEKLPCLSVLVLHNSAFVGKNMTCSSLGMPQLKRLKLSDLPNLESLIVKEGGMGKLSTLAIDRCLSLKKLPDAQSLHTSLQQLTVTRMSPAFMDRLHKERVDFHNMHMHHSSESVVSLHTRLQQLKVTRMSPAFMDRLHKERVDFHNMHAPFI